MEPDVDNQRLAESEALRSLLQRKVRMCFALSAIMTVVFFSYFFALAWLPEWMGSRAFAGSSVSVGVYFTVIALLFGVGISAFYIWWAHHHFDPQLQTILREHGFEED